MVPIWAAFRLRFHYRCSVVAAMRVTESAGRVWKPPGKVIQAAVFIAMLPVYLPLLVILCVWTAFRRVIWCEPA